MYTIDELVQLKQAGFSAEEIMKLSGTDKTEPVKAEPKQEAPVPEPISSTPVKDQSPDMFQEMLDSFSKTMNEQMEAFKSAIQLSNINRDSTGYKTATVNDVVANIIRPNGQERK